jgi:hypothetical protein
LGNVAALYLIDSQSRAVRSGASKRFG